MPEFKKVEDIKVAKVKGNEVLLKGNAHFYNPNDLKITLKEVNIDVSIKGKKIGTINHTEKVKIAPLSDFKIPVDAMVNLAEAGLINNLLNVLSGKKIKAHYRGYVKMVIHGLPVKVPVDHEKSINFF